MDIQTADNFSLEIAEMVEPRKSEKEFTKILKGFIGTDSLTQEDPMEAAEEEKEEEEKEEMMEEDTTKVGGQVQGLDIHLNGLQGAASMETQLDALNRSLMEKDEELRLAKEEAASERLATKLAKEEAREEKLAKIKARSRHNTEVADWDQREKEVRKEYTTSNPPIIVDLNTTYFDATKKAPHKTGPPQP